VALEVVVMRAILRPLSDAELDQLAGVLARAFGRALAEYHTGHATWGLPGELAGLMADLDDCKRTRPRRPRTTKAGEPS
jgi:hypothetical protein